MNGAAVSPITATCCASSASRMARKSRTTRVVSTRSSPGITAKVTVSAMSAASARALGPRTANTTGVCRSGPSRSRSAVTVSRTWASRPLGGTTGSPSSLSSSSMPGLPVPIPISKRPSVSTDRECASHAVLPGLVQRGGIHPSAYTQVGEGGCDGERGSGCRLPSRDVRHQQRGVAAVGDMAHSVSPRRQVCPERGNDSESERSRFARRHRFIHRSSPSFRGASCPAVVGAATKRPATCLYLAGSVRVRRRRWAGRRGRRRRCRRSWCRGARPYPRWRGGTGARRLP